MSDLSRVAEPQLNATPLIDVMLVLLVILIITLPVATHAVKLNLPQGPLVAPPPPAIRLSLYSGGDIYWNDERIESLEQLMPRLQALGRQANAPALRVVPEKRVPYEQVAQVLAAAQRSLVRSLSIAPISD
jgi:biopolymer transport protein ExbD